MIVCGRLTDRHLAAAVRAKAVVLAACRGDDLSVVYSKEIQRAAAS